MADVGNLTAKLTLDTASFDSAIGGVSGTVGKLAQGVGTALGSVTAAVGAAVGAAAVGVGKLVSESVQGFAQFEQLAGGAQKIFDQIDYSKIEQDANNAWQTMNLSASQYLSMINTVGATFAATMGDNAGYEAAKNGMQAIADYASGTGRSVDELSQKFSLITRSTASYQSIADQFSGILPATSAAFLEQAQSAGLLSSSYEKLTDVPLAEYQSTVVEMLGQGVAALNLTGNTAMETSNTVSGSFNGMKAAWDNLVVSLSTGGPQMEASLSTFVGAAQNFLAQVIPVIGQALQSIAQVIQGIAPIIAAEIPQLVATVGPMLLSAAVTIVESVSSALPGILGSIMDALSALLPQIAVTITTLLSSLIGEIIPMIIVFGGQLIASLATTITENAPALASSLMAAISIMISTIGDILPLFVTAGVQLVAALATSFTDNAQMIVGGVIQLLTILVQTIIANLPTIIEAGLQIVLGLVVGIVSNLGMITDSLIQMIVMIPTVILEHIGEIMEAALQIGLAIAAGILLAIPNLVLSIGRMLGIVKEAEEGYGKSTTSISEKSDQMKTDVNSSITDITSTLQGLTTSVSSTSSSLTSAVTNMGSSVKQVTVPVYDSMGNLIRTFEATQYQANNTAQNVAGKSSEITTSTAKIIENTSMAESRINMLSRLVAEPQVDPSGVVDGCAEITVAVENAIAALERLSRTTAAGGGFGGGHAVGGWMNAGTTYLVGEMGPELITPTRSGYVHTAEETEEILGGSNGGDIVININGDVYDNARSMKQKMRSAVLGIMQEQVAYG